MEDIKFNHTLPIQLRFNDVDKFGHVNNTVYFSFYDLGKTEYFASVCPHVDWQKDGIVVVHIEANFLAQIYVSSLKKVLKQEFTHPATAGITIPA